MANLPSISDELSKALDDLEAAVHNSREDELEKDLSVNEWVDRVKGATISAHGFARTGEQEMEAREWLELAAIALRRVAHVRSS